jgi:hypothetical protein
MTKKPEQRAGTKSTTVKKAGALVRKGIYYTSILLAVTIGSYSIHYEVSSPRIDLRKQFRIISHDKIEIKGPEGFLEATVSALNLLRRKDLENYRMVQNYLGKIECVKRGSGVYMWERPPRFIVGEKSVEEPTRIYASSIVHEAYHSKLYNDALHNGRSKAEASEVSTGRQAELACSKVQGESLAKISGFLPFRLLDWLNLALSARRRHEEIPYEDRYW